MNTISSSEFDFIKNRISEEREIESKRRKFEETKLYKFLVEINELEKFELYKRKIAMTILDDLML